MPVALDPTWFLACGRHFVAIAFAWACGAHPSRRLHWNFVVPPAGLATGPAPGSLVYSYQCPGLRDTHTPVPFQGLATFWPRFLPTLQNPRPLYLSSSGIQGTDSFHQLPKPCLYSILSFIQPSLILKIGLGI